MCSEKLLLSWIRLEYFKNFDLKLRIEKVILFIMKMIISYFEKNYDSNLLTENETEIVKYHYAQHH